MTLATELISHILSAAAASADKTVAGLWCDGPSDGGYLVRSDGAVVAVGEFQDVP